ncbi:N/A [soil metagenome]
MKVAGLLGWMVWVVVGVTGVVHAADADNAVLVSNAQVTVTRADFDAEMERIPQADRFEFLASRERIGRMLQEILTRKTLASEARALGLDKSPAALRKITVAQERTLAEERVNHLEQEVKLPNFELRARELYKLNPERFTEKPTIRASHILIGTKDRSKDAALKLAQDVHAQLVAGKDFGELAAKYSDDNASKARKGDLGYFPADAMVKPFADAAFALKKGAISAPVESDFGFHLIQVVDTKPGGKQSYDDVKSQIIGELKASYVAEFKMAHVSKTRDDKSMKSNEDEIMKLKTTIPSSSSGK